MKIHTKKTRGFTLVETLVAVAVLMIAIAGPLVVASKGLTAALYARDQMIATMLAQEEMEVIKNLRDNSVLLNGDDQGHWLDGFTTPVNCIGSANTCDVSNFFEGATHFLVDNCNSDQCLLHFHPGYGYTSNSDGSTGAAVFSRSFYLTPVGNEPANEYQVHVSVTWYEGSVQNQVDLTSQLTQGTQ